MAPSPATAGAHFGESVANAGDLDGDGQDDIVIGAPAFVDSNLGSAITGRVYAFRSNGSSIWDADDLLAGRPPSPQAANRPASRPTRFGETVARLGDVGSCPAAAEICNVGPPDGRAEILVSAPGTDTGDVAGEDQGAVYVLDGATGKILKVVQLRERPFAGSAGFGKALAPLSGQPACAGNGGLGDCPYAAGSAVAVGDLDGGGKPDFIVGAPDFGETIDTLEGRCAETCPGVGRVYVFHGEFITGSATSPLRETDEIGGGPVTSKTILYPGALGAGEPPHFGTAVAPLGDVGTCDAALPCNPTNVANGVPDIVATAAGADAGATDAGLAFLMDPGANAVLASLTDPQLVEGGAFGSFRQALPAPGDVGAGAAPDPVIGASLGAGSVAAFSGDVAAPVVIASITEPAPTGGGAFGTSIAGLGDVAGDAPGELLLGAPGSATAHLVSACAGSVLRTFGDPGGQAGSRFGASSAPLGDRNGDGFIDFVVGAPDADSGAGRAYAFTSTPPAAAPFTGCGGPLGPDEEGTAGSTSGTKASPPGTKATPPAKVSARVLRRLALAPSKRRLSRGRALRLRGSLRASAGQASCQSRQKIAIQRRKLTGGRYQTFDVAITGITGRFRAGTRPSRSYLYRARVSQTSRCMGATSKVARVVVRKR